MGVGNKRKCYAHPTDESLCVKVAINKGEFDRYQVREDRYLIRLARNGRKLDFISAFKGEVSTDEGPGFLYERVLDSDGTPSKTLGYYFNQGDELPSVIEAVEVLGESILKEGVLFHDVNAANIMCRRLTNGAFHLVIVDGLGPATFFSLLDIIPAHRARTIRRRWNRVISRFARDYTPLDAGRIQPL